MKRALLLTLGCKLNQAETAQLAARLAQNGVELADDNVRGRPVDLVFINTCAVTERAEAKSRHLIARAVREFPAAQVIAAGCAGEYNAALIGSIDDKVHILGAGGMRTWIESEYFENLVGNIANVDSRRIETHFRFYHRARPLIKIQDGCDHFCSFCIIPYLRGSTMRSRSAAEIVDEARELVDVGYEEINLTGVRIGAWGREFTTPQTLTGLCRELISLAGLQYIRLGSLEPWELDRELIELTADGSGVAPHMHIPLQHTVPDMLKAMNRPPLETELELLTEIRAKNPNLALGVDIVVGFPGESEVDFERLFKDLENLPITYLHVFGFSARRGTPAADFKNRIDGRVIKSRVSRLRALSAVKRMEFFRSQIGRTIRAISNHTKPGQGWTTAVTENYLKIRVPETTGFSFIGRARKYRLVFEDGFIFGIPAADV